MKGYLAALAVALIIVAFYGISWLGTCGVIKMITMCFGWDFSWAISTGIWLILCFLTSMFKGK